jgi:catechol 2,3-dioxygenase-like lactoylglutathione lyase family enzyme
MSEGPARRFLHICYVCRDADAATSRFVSTLAMRNTMRTTDDYASGAIFSMDREIRSTASFVFDHRGPRTSPALEIQQWTDPDTWGEPSTDPFRVGMRAVGFVTSTFDETLAALCAAGCVPARSIVGESPSRHITLIDPAAITIDLEEAPAGRFAHPQMHHLRATVSDVAKSIPFYEKLGFVLVATTAVAAASYVHSGASGSVTVMRLPDEAFELHLVQWSDGLATGAHYDRPNHAGLYRAAICVDDTRAAYDELSASGMVFDRPPLIVELAGTPVPDMWITFVSDPDGIPFEFVQRPRSVFR